MCHIFFVFPTHLLRLAGVGSALEDANFEAMLTEIYPKQAAYKAAAADGGAFRAKVQVVLRHGERCGVHQLRMQSYSR